MPALKIKTDRNLEINRTARELGEQLTGYPLISINDQETMTARKRVAIRRELLKITAALDAIDAIKN